ncbi:hypothetical protein PR003_g8028 [Phytophthora rubi]|uniref:Secreted protein n=1 Tax=Phytophthora rubi TaxID=129364 RepID=A0A6A3N7R2_9STRA|nr:hypothetical protein PR002_g6706 [Phytophthora rubi]KAE9039469.1 hypothetical protein PR001_g7486 [Phytophthora rubi]KAE9345282.1 hypothetical protein PR003_g8028 [Phytophthora rubi]
MKPQVWCLSFLSLVTNAHRIALGLHVLDVYGSRNHKVTFNNLALTCVDLHCCWGYFAPFSRRI